MARTASRNTGMTARLADTHQNSTWTDSMWEEIAFRTSDSLSDEIPEPASHT
jgi:hypothetical protein